MFPSMTQFSPTAPVSFISTHLDDVAISCACFIHANPGARVITACAGAPKGRRRGYNRWTTGEKKAPAAVRKRRDEDAAAMALLRATPVWLDLYDDDYRHTHRGIDDVPEIVDAVGRALGSDATGSVVFPLGFVHFDHVAVSNACLQLARDSELEWYIYADMPYSQTYPEMKEERLAEVQQRVHLESLDPYVGDALIKDEALQAYASQYGPLREERGFEAALSAPEQYWRVRALVS
jgi:LmbE family N-acetylglucosaminyl deacetylase